jgi:uncharacterized membrane protein YhaH (DUF805 family)
MGRLEIEIRHGHDHGPGQWGAVVALIVFVVLAAAGAHSKGLATFAHDLKVGAEITMAALGAAVVIALAVVVTRVAVRVRRAHRATVTRSAVPVITVTPDHAAIADDTERPALGAARRRFADIDPDAPVSHRGFGYIVPPANDRRRS